MSDGCLLLIDVYYSLWWHRHLGELGSDVGSIIRSRSVTFVVTSSPGQVSSSPLWRSKCPSWLFCREDQNTSPLWFILFCSAGIIPTLNQHRWRINCKISVLYSQKSYLSKSDDIVLKYYFKSESRHCKIYLTKSCVVSDMTCTSASKVHVNYTFIYMNVKCMHCT